MTFKKWLSLMLVAFLLLLAVAFGADGYINRSSQDKLYHELAALPEQHAALVLGTSPYLRSGQSNPYFTHRITAAAELYHAGKVKTFVVSGDNRRHSYNEPEAMKQALMAEGVPEGDIYLDYAGLRTLDSVVRMDKIFGQQSFIIVSQPFHNARAVFIAQHHGLEAYGYNATDVRLNVFTMRTFVREKLARVKVLLDIILGVQPRHLGQPEPIKASSAAAEGTASSEPNKPI
ncbi:vancomycin high temperature exclusion protein [Neisseriaceae bacterium CLB008]